MFKLFTHVLVLLGTVSCSGGNTSSLYEATTPPEKPVFPAFKTEMPEASLKFIIRNGSDLCLEAEEVFVSHPIPESVDPSKAQAIANLVKVLCNEGKWVGYKDRLNIKKGTETFLAERSAYLDLVKRAMYSERKNSPTHTVFARFQELKSIFDDEHDVFAGQKYKELMQEYNEHPDLRKGFHSFEHWVFELNEYNSSTHED